MNQRRLLPSVSMLSAFESAARLGSFSRAAVDLNLTQGAISRQIQALEHQLGVVLFHRSAQAVTLTPVGVTYAQEITAALGLVRTATLNAISQSHGGELRLAVLPTFGAKWLIPRLGDFLSQHPDINLTFKSHIKPVDFKEEGVDFAVHYGQPDWPDATCHFLMSETVLPVYSPVLEEKYTLACAEDFKQVPLLHLSTRQGHWTKWFHRHKVAFEAAHGIRFEQFSALAQATVAGLGVSLMPRLFIESELKAGSLKIFEQGACESSAAYYVVTPTYRNSYYPVVQFRNWILQQAQGYSL